MAADKNKRNKLGLLGKFFQATDQHKKDLANAGKRTPQAVSPVATPAVKRNPVDERIRAARAKRKRRQTQVRPLGTGALQ